jgi:hypothetical protein
LIIRGLPFPLIALHILVGKILYRVRRVITILVCGSPLPLLLLLTGKELLPFLLATALIGLVIDLLALLVREQIVDLRGGGGEVSVGSNVVCHGYRIAQDTKNTTTFFIFLKILFYFSLDMCIVLHYTCPAGPGCVSA